MLELGFGPAGGVGRFSMQQLVDEHSECPDIGLGAVYVMNEALGGHVDWGSNVDILKFFPA